MADEPTIHRFDDAAAAAAFAAERTAPDRARTELGLHTVVLVQLGTNTAYARLNDPGSDGHLQQRWLRHERRSASPCGWSEQHHPRSEQHVGAWKDAHAEPLDTFLIRTAKDAWRLLGEPPYVVELPVRALAAIEHD